MRKINILILLLLVGCSTTPPKSPTTPTTIIESKPPVVEIKEELKLGKKYKLWSTYYLTPKFTSSTSQKYCLRSASGKCISGKLSLDHWCMIGLQGTGRVDNNTYTYAKPTSSHRVPCEKSFLRKASFAYSTGKIKYSVTKHAEGNGNRNNPLKGYHSIACDQKKFKYGQKFYIPALKKVVVCEDVGGAIKGNHIDTFIGLIDLRNPTKFANKYGYAFSTMPSEYKAIIKSKSNETFDAYIVE